MKKDGQQFIEEIHIFQVLLFKKMKNAVELALHKDVHLFQLLRVIIWTH